MCAIPEQTEASWEYSLSKFISLGVGHVSVYPLTIEDGTALQTNSKIERLFLNAQHVQADRMQAEVKDASSSGFERHECSVPSPNQKSCKAQ